MLRFTCAVLPVVAAAVLAGCGDAPATKSFGRGVGRLELRWLEGIERKTKEHGTAFLVGSDGHLLTAHHVADHGRSARDQRGPEKAARLVVVLPGSPAVEVEIVAEDPEADLALLKLAEPIAVGPLPPLRLAEPPMGSEIVLAGYPLGEPQAVVRAGRLVDPELPRAESPLGEPLPDWVVRLRDGGYLLAGIAVRVGDSGAPVYLAETGEIIGLCSAGTRSPEGARGLLDHALVVPAPRIVRFLDAHGVPHT